MQLAESPKKRTLIGLTPLIDIVFILLIFFMLASSFIDWQFFELGVSESETMQFNSNRQSLIRVEQGEKYFLNGKKMPIENIVSEVRERVRNNLGHVVLVQPAVDLPLQQLVNVLDGLKYASVSNISLTRQAEAN